ncbi:hypothetical protein D3C73_1592620 [compost metagenome]
MSFSAFQAVFQQYDHREVTNEELVAADILAGTAAGVRTYGVRWLSTYQSLVYEVEPDGIFERVAEFRGLLAKS